jgi:hypothetical protein
MGTAIAVCQGPRWQFFDLKILLILQIFVRRQNYLEPGDFRGRQQIAVLECSPALLGRGADFVFIEISAKR